MYLSTHGVPRSRASATWVLVLVVALVGVLATGAGVLAAPAPAVRISPLVGVPGESAVVSLSGFPKSALVSVSWAGADGAVTAVATAVTRKNGSLDVGAVLPAVGAYTLRAQSGGTSAEARFTVQAAASLPTATATAAPAATQTPIASPVPSVTPTPVPTPSSEATLARLVSLVNAERQKAGLPPVVVHAALSRSAQDYAALMAATGCFAHDCGGTSAQLRARAAGYTAYANMGEVLAAAYLLPETVVEAWMASSGHRDALLHPAYRDTGVGVAYGGAYGIYWVQVLAEPA